MKKHIRACLAKASIELSIGNTICKLFRLKYTISGAKVQFGLLKKSNPSKKLKKRSRLKKEFVTKILIMMMFYLKIITI
jgi:hypothetical protein